MIRRTRRSPGQPSRTPITTAPGAWSRFNVLQRNLFSQQVAGCLHHMTGSTTITNYPYHPYHLLPLPPLPPATPTTISTPSPREPEAVATTAKSGRDSPISLLDLSSYQSRAVNQNKVTSPADLQHAGPDAPSVIVRGPLLHQARGK